MNLISDLFGNTAKIKSRDRSTVKRSKMDDGLYDAMAEKAKLFKNVIDKAPELDHTGEGSSEYVPHWRDLVGDMFKSLVTHEEPGVKSPEEIKPSREVNRRVMQNLLGSDHFDATRPITRGAEIEAAFATMGMADELRETLTNEMSELAEEAKNAEKQEKTIEREEEKAQELREQVKEQGGQVNPQQQEALQDAVNRKHNAQARLGKSMESMEEMPVTVGAAASLEQAAEQGKKDAQLIQSLPGIGAGDNQKLSPDEALRLAKMFKDNPRLMKVAEMLGRILRDMRFKRARRITGGHEESVDVMLGDEIEYVLPAEKVLLMDEITELDFMRRYHERSLLQYEMRGTEEAGYGPLIICRDESYSMEGQRNIWAAAVSLALVAIARKEKRDAAVISYASEGEQQLFHFRHKEPFDAGKVVEMAGHFFAGGTDATPAIKMAAKLTDTDADFTKADLVLISDGEDYYEDEDAKLRDELNARGVRMHGVMVGAAPSEYQTEMCDTLVSAFDLAGSNEATDMLAENIS